MCVAHDVFLSKFSRNSRKKMLSTFHSMPKIYGCLTLQGNYTLFLFVYVKMVKKKNMSFIWIRFCLYVVYTHTSEHIFLLLTFYLVCFIGCLFYSRHNKNVHTNNTLQQLCKFVSYNTWLFTYVDKINENI